MKNIEKILFVTILAFLIGALIGLILPYPYNFFVSLPMSMAMGWYATEIYDFLFGER
jgi:uncharacterized membrane protein YbjE (DUF340 family)